MTDYMNDSLADLKAAILGDGIIDDNEVGKLRERLYADGIIDREEADFLFDLNDAVSGKDNAASWGELFVEAIAAHVLEDDVSPGEIDDDEAAWLIGKIQGDGQVDQTERKLLEVIFEKAKSAPDSLRALLS
jgi:hypothetical protein